MQDDCLDVSNKPFYKRWKTLIPLPRGASFRTSKIRLMLTWRLRYGGAVITSITVVVTQRMYSYNEYSSTQRLSETHTHITFNSSEGCLVTLGGAPASIGSVRGTVAARAQAALEGSLNGINQCKQAEQPLITHPR